MQIKIGNIRIDTQSRLSKHRGYLYDQLTLLHQEIIELVLEGEARNKIPIRELKLKAKLMKKYRRRLKLLSTY